MPITRERTSKLRPVTNNGVTAAAAALLILAAFFASCFALLSSPQPAPHKMSSSAQHETQSRSAPHAASVLSIRTARPIKGSPCPLAIPNGQVLQQTWGILRVERGNIARIQNHAGHSAILKLRDIMLGETRVALFVAKGAIATYDRVPEGKYLAEYAIGDELDSTCSTFAHLVHSGLIGVIDFTAGGDASAGRHVQLDITIPAPTDRDAGIDSIRDDVFDFD
jgi:hypothetical protein